MLSAAWGLGVIRAVDAFYRRVTVDFRVRKGHQFTYAAACETLALAPENHILVTQKADPDRIAQMLRDKPGAFVKEMLGSFGDMPVSRLEELCAQHGFVKQANWKPFWDKARAELRHDACVEIPTRRAEPLHLKATKEDYGTGWFTALSQMREPRSILASVRELQSSGGLDKLSEDDRAKIADRLAFALKGAKGVDDALYARIAFCISDFSLDGALAQNAKLEHARPAKVRAYLWERGLGDEPRYLRTARELPVREVGNLVAFLASGDCEAAKATLLDALPQMCFALLSATLARFIKDPACEDRAAALLKSPTAPATLVALVLGRYETFSKEWTKLPPLVVILMHAIALGEGRQGGETLRMQNMIRRLFADQKWLEGIFRQLGAADQALFFERFQASIAWDPSTHHMIVVRMTRIAPALAARQVRREEVKKIERITSLRSYAARQAAYERLVRVEIPENTKRIEFAKSYGDLSENAEYQYAKDEQRALMQKESLLQKDLNEVKAVDFADVAEPAAVCAGSMVTISTEGGETRVYAVLGEWDNDPDRGILSNKTRLAQNMLGKKAGDTFDLPDAEGRVSVATIQGVAPLSDEIRAWIAAAPEAV